MMINMLTIEEVEKILKCSGRQVWRLIEKGALAKVLLGRRSARVTQKSLEEFIKGGGIDEEIDGEGAPLLNDAVAKSRAQRFTNEERMIYSAIGTGVHDGRSVFIIQGLISDIIRKELIEKGYYLYSHTYKDGLQDSSTIISLRELIRDVDESVDKTTSDRQQALVDDFLEQGRAIQK